MPEVSAESTYLFRHALLRAGAYELQLPRERAALHELAFQLIEEAYGGRVPEPPPIDSVPLQGYSPFPVDTVAAELADHARSAADCGSVALAALRLRYLRRAAEYAESLYQHESAVRLWRELAAQPGVADRAVIDIRVGLLLDRLGRPAEAENAFRDAHAYAREHGLRQVQAAALLDLSVVLRNFGRRDDSQAALEESLALYLDVGNRRREGGVLAMMASLSQSKGDFAQAEKLIHEALTVARDIGFAELEATLLGNLGIAQTSRGNNAQAEENLLLALKLHQGAGSTLQTGIVLGNLARLHHMTGRFEQAARLYGEALELHRAVGNCRFEGMALCDLALCQADLAQLQQARTGWRQGAAILAEIGDHVTIACMKKDMHETCTRLHIAPWNEGAAWNPPCTPS